MITTTTQSINKEDARRFFVIGTDESEEQTIKIIQHNLRKASSPKFEAEIGNSDEQLELLAGFYEEMAEKVTDILIPFGSKLSEILPKYLQMRTNITRIIQITKLMAFVNLQNRKWLVTNEDNVIKNYLVADIDDFNQAIKMMDKIMTESNSDLSQGSLKLLEVLQKFQKYEIEKNTPVELLLSDYTNIPPSISDCIKAMNIPRATFYTYLDPLRDKGYVEDVKYPNCKQTFLALTEQHVKEFSINELEFSENELKEWIENEFGNNTTITNSNN
jgi:DNA-binding MarR family transcriptional regulator